MRGVFCFVFTIIFAYFAFSPSGLAMEEIPISLGQQFSLPVEKNSKFSVGNPQVIQVRNVHVEDGKAVLLVRGNHEGFSDLIIFHKDKKTEYGFRVISKRKAAELHDVQSALGKNSGIEIVPNGPQWVARGEAKTIDDQNLLEAFSVAHEGKIQRLNTLSREARLLAENKIREQLKFIHLDTIQVRSAGSRVWLEGTVLSAAEKDLALQLAREIYQGTESRIKYPFELEKIVRFKVRILELLKTATDSRGFLWNTSIPGIIAFHQKLLRGNISLEATLNILAKRGFARILSEPTVAVNAKGIAELKVGGEIPITLRTRSQQSVIWKSYGLHLKIEVPGSSESLVRTKLNVEVSTLDTANSVEGIPGIKLNQMETIVDLTIAKTVFLSGLIQEQNGELENALPFLGSIPVLGALFRSREFLDRKSELVIAITAVQNQEI